MQLACTGGFFDIVGKIQKINIFVIVRIFIRFWKKLTMISIIFDNLIERAQQQILTILIILIVIIVSIRIITT